MRQLPLNIFKPGPLFEYSNLKEAARLQVNRTRYTPQDYRLIRFVKRYLDEIGELLPTLPAAEERKLLRRYQSGCEESRNKLFLANQYIVIEEILYFVDKGMELEDLVQNANLALLFSLDSYSIDGKDNLKNYLHRNIYRYLHNNLRDNVSIIRYPQNRLDEIVSYYITEIFYRQQNLIQPVKMLLDLYGLVQLIEETNVDYDWVPYLRVSDRLLDGHYIIPTLESSTELEFASEHILEILSSLKETEGDVIRKYFGLGYDHTFTLQEIADEYDLTRERIRQIKEKALLRLKHPVRSWSLRSLIDAYECTEACRVPIKSHEILHCCVVDPFSTICDIELKSAVRELEEYVAPKRRKTPYPHLKNMAAACRRKLVATLEEMGRPCSYTELKDYIYEAYPLLRNGTLEYALETVNEVAYIGKGLYALKGWGYIEEVKKKQHGEISNTQLGEYLEQILEDQEVPVSFIHLLSLLAPKFNRTRFSSSDEKRILRLIKRRDHIYQTLDNRFYIVEGWIEHDSKP